MTRIGMGLGGLLGLLLLADVAAASDAASDEDAIRIGGSCAALAYVTVEQLRASVQSAFGEELHAFCHPEEPFDCSDYTPFLKGAGTLATGDDGHYCRLRLDD